MAFDNRKLEQEGCNGLYLLRSICKHRELAINENYQLMVAFEAANILPHFLKLFNVFNGS